MKRILLLFLLGACNESSSATPDPKSRAGGVKFPVEVQKVESRRVEYAVTGIGNVAAYETVQVTARVGGAVEKVLFLEGDVVKEGAPLVEIEPRRYQVAVQQARAAMVKAQAAVGDAKAGLERREAAVAQSPGLIPGEEIATFRTRMQAGQADVAAARAALDLAQLNLKDAYVRAPASGIIETRTVQTGQYLQPGTVLATLVRREPLLLRFQVAEAEARELRPGMPVKFRVRSEEAEHHAKITHVAGAASETTRMVSITAAVEDTAARAITPGAFAEITTPVAAVNDAPVIPLIAVRPSEKGFLAFVVEDDVARERQLTLGLRTPDGRVEVKSGVKPGELLVVRGAEALREGAKVRVAGPEQKPVKAAP